MKRLSLFILSIFGMLILNAQESTIILLNYSALEKKVNKSNAEIKHPKKSLKYKTWVKRGQIMQDVYSIDLEQIYDGMSTQELKLFYKDPVKEVQQEIRRKNYTIYEYPRMHYYFLNDGLSLWKRIKSAYENPLDEALSSYKKAIELDQGGKVEAQIKPNLDRLINQLKQLGINDYYSGNRELALKAFENVLEINRLPVYQGYKDTVMIQYCGIISRESEKYQDAIKYYKELNEIQRSPDNYLLIKEDYCQLSDTASAMKILEEGLSVFPDSVNVFANLIDLCIKTNKIEEGLTIANEAIEKNPSNGYFHYWKGRLLIKSEIEDRIEQALEAYQRAIDANPKLSYAYFDKGFIYFLLGQEYYTRAGEEKDIKTRDFLNQEGQTNYEKSIPLLEKAAELSQSDRSMLVESYETLKRIYYKLQLMDKYNEISEKIKNM